jgi:hypothetical protein
MGHSTHVARHMTGLVQSARACTRRSGVGARSSRPASRADETGRLQIAYATGRKPQETRPLSSRESPAGLSAPAAPSASLKTPPTAAALAYGGVIPFFAGAAASAATVGADQALALQATQLYSASILSFVGAVHWGVALSDRGRSGDFVYSVLPSLFGWGAALAAPGVGLGAMVPAFVGAYAYDVRRFGAREGRGHVPEWYLPLRLKLTVCASSALAFSCVVAQGARAEALSGGNAIVVSKESN